MLTDLRIKFIRFFRKNKIIIFIIICAIVIIMIINKFLKNYEAPVKPQTTYEPHTSVMDSDSVPTKQANEIEKMIEEYVNYCNEADFASAFNMLSDQCKEIEFDNNLTIYMSYVYTKMPTPKKYSIQNYSNDGDTYIYQIRYTDDILATGLTNSEYQYTEEKMIFKKTKNGIEMSVGNFVEYSDIKNIFENDYIKIDLKNVTKYYSVEKYQIKFSNRSNYTVVIADDQEENEVILKLNAGDFRNRNEETNIVLKPGQSQTVNIGFSKFYDNNNDASNIIFDSIRVMEKYSGTVDIAEEIIQSEIQNAIAKFSVNVPLTTK